MFITYVLINLVQEFVLIYLIITFLEQPFWNILYINRLSKLLETRSKKMHDREADTPFAIKKAEKMVKLVIITDRRLSILEKLHFQQIHFRQLWKCRAY